VSDEGTSDQYAPYAEADVAHAQEFRGDATVLHAGAEDLHERADDVQAAGLVDDAGRLRAEGDRLEAKADDYDRRADLLEDAATQWHEAAADDHRSDIARTRAEAAFKTKFELGQRINSTALTDDETTELRIQEGRAAGEESALRARSEQLSGEAGFDKRLADEEEKKAYEGLARPERPKLPEAEPNPELLPPE